MSNGVGGALDQEASLCGPGVAEFAQGRVVGGVQCEGQGLVVPSRFAGEDGLLADGFGTCEWVKKGEPLCLIGDSGTGKSHLLIGLGTAAAVEGHRVRYALAAKLVNELVEAADEKQLSKTIARYGRVDLLCIDELGYLELDRRGVEMLFQVLTEREEKKSVAIASNESFGGWTKTFTDPRLCAAIVDRLTFNGAIIETGTESYRLAQTKAKQQQAKK
ncbi:ATP-binding protein [Streptomyces sp. NPDC085665]|uniref:ATP-binding protein n=1 Tax=Streptomyces sp. NPDC085665 TaxID=3365735 RepID=UPI0037CF4ACC